MSKPIASISIRLREALDASGMKQADLIRETGLDRGAVSKYLSGQYEPKQKAIYLMARALDVSEAWLLGYDVPKTRSVEQLKNDDLVQVIARLRKDLEFFEAVQDLSELGENEFQNIRQLLVSLRKK